MPGWLAGFHFPTEDFRVDLLLVRIGYIPTERALGQGFYFARREHIPLLEGVSDVVRSVALLIKAHFPLNFAEGFAEAFGCATFDGAGKNVADGVEDDVGLFLVVVLHELALVLGSDYYGYPVASGSVDEIVKPFQVDSRKLVD